MKFYELTHPEYSTDRQFDRENPVRVDGDSYLPGIDCPICGIKWSSSNRIRTSVEITNQIRQYLKSNKIPNRLSADEWDEFSIVLSSKFGLLLDVLRPGAEFGPPVGLISRRSNNHLLHPFPGVLWVSNAVASALREAKFYGIDFWNVKLDWATKKAELADVLPTLVEVYVNQKAWRIGMDEEKVTTCRKCRKMKFLQPDMLKIDQSRWNGTDFMNPDRNPNIVIVTERVCEILDKCRFTNYSCIEV